MQGNSEYEKILKEDQNVNVNEYARKQLGFLGEPLLVREGILKPIRVAHMNSGDWGYHRGAPMVDAKGAPMADFIYDDVVARAKEVLSRYLCGEDELLENESQLSRKILTHLKKYHSLVRETTKEAKRALDSKRMTSNGVRSVRNLKFGAYLNMENLEKKKQELAKRINKLKSISLSERVDATRAKAMLQFYKHQEKAVKTRLHFLPVKESNQPSNPPICAPGLQKVFGSTMTQDKHVCVPHNHLSPFPSTNPNTNPNLYNNGALKSAGRVPFRTLYGDRLVKKRLVYHSFIQRLNSALYPNYTRDVVNMPGRHPVRKRFSGLFAGSNKDPMLKSQNLIWKHGLRSFGSKGPQSYWIQLVREMYDTRRVEHVRKLTRTIRVNQPQTFDQIRKHFVDVNEKLGGNLGVTCYGYSCVNPRRPQERWEKSYHRFGRAWYCMDISPGDYQLPFGCYNDRCAPPTKSLQRMNYFVPVTSEMPDEPSRPRDELAQIAVNQICTTLLQRDGKKGSQARYGHVRTALNTAPLGRLPPAEAFAQIKLVRSWTDDRNEKTTAIATEGNTKGQTNSNTNGTTNGNNGNTGTTNSNNGNTTNSNNGNTGKVVIEVGKESPTLETHILYARRAISSLTNAKQANTESINDNIRNVLLMPPNANGKQRYNFNMIKNDEKRKQFKAQQETVVNDGSTNIRITYQNIHDSRLSQKGGGLRKGSADERKRDAKVLDNNFLMVDGDISTGYSTNMPVVAYGGSERVLGIARKKVGRDFVRPLILPLASEDSNYKDVRENMRMHFETMYDDATTGVKGLVERQMRYVCEPLLQTGALMKGTHFNDLMRRFLALVGNPANGLTLESKLKSPVLLNIMKCLQFYLYVHVGLSADQALKAIKSQEARRQAYQMQTDMYSLAHKLRLLGNTGPMPSQQFKKIVRQYLLTEGKGSMSRDNVDKEIAAMEAELRTFKVFGMRIARDKLLPSFLRPQAIKKMGIPASEMPFLKTGTAYQATKDFVTSPLFSDTGRRLSVAQRNRQASRNRAAELRELRKPQNRP